jgi:hypothetical protein
VALSGGWSIAVRSVPIYISHRTGNGWFVGPYPSNGTQVTVYVVCLQHVPGATITEREATITVPAHSGGKVAATCNPGEVLVGGGMANHASANALSTWGARDPASMASCATIRGARQASQSTPSV